MALKIFISYSTSDLQVVQYIQSALAGSTAEIFVAEYTVLPGSSLSETIITAIKECDLFILLWSKNSQASDWVPQEIGVAKSSDKKIMPIVLQSGLSLPGFISNLKYLDITKDPQAALNWLKNNVLETETGSGLVLKHALGRAALWFDSLPLEFPLSWS